MTLLSVHKNTDGSFSLYLTAFPSELFKGFNPNAIEYMETGSLDDMIGAVERLVVANDPYRLFTLERYGEDSYGMVVIRGAAHLHEYLKKEVPACKGPVRVLRNALLCVPAPGVELPSIPFSQMM